LFSLQAEAGSGGQPNTWSQTNRCSRPFLL